LPQAGLFKAFGLLQGKLEDGMSSRKSGLRAEETVARPRDQEYEHEQDYDYGMGTME